MFVAWLAMFFISKEGLMIYYICCLLGCDWHKTGPTLTETATEGIDIGKRKESHREKSHNVYICFICSSSNIL
jgi:hypothetical protein